MFAGRRFTLDEIIQHKYVMAPSSHGLMAHDVVIHEQTIFRKQNTHSPYTDTHTQTAMTLIKFGAVVAFIFFGTPAIIKRMPTHRPRVILPREGIDNPEAYTYNEYAFVEAEEQQQQQTAEIQQDMATPVVVPQKSQEKAEVIDAAPAPKAVPTPAPAVVNIKKNDAEEDKYEALAKKYMNRK